MGNVTEPFSPGLLTLMPVSIVVRNILVFSMVAELMTGCAMHYIQYSVSRPQASERSIITSEGRMELDEAQIYVRPTNHVKVGEGFGWSSASVKPVQNWFRGTPYFGGGTQNRFFVELYIKAKHKLTVAPAEMVLTTANGQSMTPSAYLGPLNMWSTGNYSLALCDPSLDRKNAIDKKVILKENDSLCMALIYDIKPPLPNEEFRLNLNGVEVENKRVVLPTIIFEQDLETSAHP